MRRLLTFLFAALAALAISLPTAPASAAKVADSVVSFKAGMGGSNLTASPTLSGEMSHIGPVDSEKHIFAHGVSPVGERWAASAGVSNRGDHKREFEVRFQFSLGFRWGIEQNIPNRGRKQERGQADGYTGPLSGGALESAAFGIAGPEVETIKMKMSDDSSLEVHPTFPPMALRRAFIWMRGFRYFLQYYRGAAYVTEYWLYDANGKRVGCNNYAEGSLSAAVCGFKPVT